MTLIERIESADGPDRELDAEIAVAIRYFPQNVGFVWKNDLEPNCPEIGRVTCVTSLGTGGPHYAAPRYTASIDAALTLVPEGWRPYSADMSIAGRTRFVIEGPKTQWATDDAGEKCAGADWYTQGVASTPALALCAAALKARGL